MAKQNSAGENAGQAALEDDASPGDPSLEDQLRNDLNAAGDEGDEGQQQEAAEEAAEQTWRDQAKEFGLDLSSYDDDGAALRHLAGISQQAEQLQGQLDQSRQLAQYGQEYLQHAPEFKQWLQEREATKAQEPVDPLAPPEFDPVWLSMVQRDENNVIVPVPSAGGTPEIAAKVQSHFNWRQNFAANPYKYLESFVDKRAEERAKALVQQEVERIQKDFHQQQFLANNRSWLFEHDANGQPVMVDGRMKPSEEGQLLGQFLQQAQQAGYTPQQQQDIAMEKLQLVRQFRANQGANSAAGKQPPAKPRATQVKEDFLTSSAGFNEHAAQPAASTRTPVHDDEPPQNENHSIEDMLRASFRAANISDAELAAV